MTKTFALAALALSLATPLAQAQDTGNWLVRGRILHLDSANGDTTGLGLSVNNKTFPEVDIGYFFAPNLAAELILTYPQKHDLRAGGAKIGSLKHLPPTLTLQYHLPVGGSRAYLGAGLNLTRFSSVRFEPAVVTALNPRIDRTSVGWALQAGVDVPVGGGWLFNLDIKKVALKTDVFAGSTKAGTFKVDPVLFSVGIGQRF